MFLYILGGIVIFLILVFALICIYAFGYQKLMNFSNNDLTVVNRLVNQLDDQVAKLDLEPADHGSLLLAKLKDAIF